MKYKIVASLSAVTLFLAGSVMAKSISDSDTTFHPVIIKYLMDKGKQEQITGVAASVFIPTTKGNDTGGIYSYFAGNAGAPPYATPLNKNNLFEIGSITKSFTAAIILQLEAENKLSINDPIGKWLPQYPQWKDVTIKQLLNMTSGIPNYSADPTFDAELEKNNKTQWTDAQLLTYASPDKPISSELANHFNYSNSNYILAGLIIEKITGKSFASQLQSRIFNKFDFMNSFYPAGKNGVKIYNNVMSRMAHGYYYDEGNKTWVDVTGNNLSWAGPAGAIVADMPDVIRWVQLLYHGLPFDMAHRANALRELSSVVSMSTGQPLAQVNSEEPKGFGLGVGYFYDDKTQNRYWVYEGSTLGFRVMYLLSACNNITVAVALNSKAGEGAPDSPIGDGIKELSVTLYQAAIAAYPDYSCTN